MKLTICILSALAVLVVQAPIVNAEDRPTKSAKTKKAPAPPAALTLPAGAVQVEPGSYTHTDAKGKKWIYRQTPFGLSRAEDKPAETAPVAKGPVITATEVGDTIKFERPGPFGNYRWEKKKNADLDADERAAWEQSKQGAAAKAK